MQKMKRGKAPGPSGVTTDLLRYAGETGIRELKKVFELMETEERVPTEWCCTAGTADTQELSSSVTPAGMQTYSVSVFIHTQTVTTHTTRDVDTNNDCNWGNNKGIKMIKRELVRTEVAEGGMTDSEPWPER